ncbi:MULTISPECIES: molybdopterin-synthase adenylyltransferase MoeB [Ferrimicrobium]|uniref:molybdopterin-synthase adenylyltransferase MoeB n=1 Tax=Ferrimicrobium TaxID=121038 RepID=UPI0023F4AA5C|nr:MULTISPECIES: molybdopterin-synthase adenylyltransferase MoeB [Ferrimicrobium]
MSNFRELLTNARAQINEVEPAALQAKWDSEWVLLDVREPEEAAQGTIPGSILLPRGNLELQVETVIPDKATPILVYCTAGVRSCFAALTLGQLGYTNVTSLSGGFEAWKDQGGTWQVPKRLDDTQRRRYHRHLLLPEVGEEGQRRLLDSRVLLLGAGGLGSPIALYLAAAGVGTLGILDMDEVDLSNLQRQIIHTTDSVGMRKVDSARATVRALNPDVNVATYDVHLDTTNTASIIAEYDLVVDGTDNFATRYVINDAAIHANIPVVHGSIYRFEGQVTVFAPPQGPCYRCFQPTPPPIEFAPSCSQAGVFGVLPGIIGSLQATEVLKLLLGIGETLVGRLLTYDALTQTLNTYRLKRDPQCPSCGTQSTNLSDQHTIQAV